MIQISPVVRISVGLALITVSVFAVLLALHVVPDPMEAPLLYRKGVVQALTSQCAIEVSRGEDPERLRGAVDAMVADHHGVRSVGIRLVNGEYLAQTEGHAAAWQAEGGAIDEVDRWQVGLYENGVRWGSLEIRFEPARAVGVFGVRVPPVFTILLILGGLSYVCFFIFIRRVLRALDPTAVMPSRVKKALDSLNDAVVLLDDDARLVFANQVFLEKVGEREEDLIGREIDILGWEDSADGKAGEQLPWRKSLAQVANTAGTPMRFVKGGIEVSFVVNTTVIVDGRGKGRGVMVTFQDVTEIEKKNEQLRSMLKLLKESKEEVQRKNIELEYLATRDPLSSCLNRRAFFDIAEKMMQKSVGSGEPVSCIMSDIDFFKKINDTYGHGIGDEAIKFVAKAFQSLVREGDVVCRYGGEEFCVMLQSCPLTGAMNLAERVRAYIEKHGAAAIPDAPGIQLTVSCGVSCNTFGATSVDELVGQADQGLYQAKEGGRNQVVAWEPEGEQPSTLPSQMAPVS